MNKETYNLLLVDDHQLVIDGIKSMLSDDKRYLVKNIATNGQQALDIIKNSPESFDIVITDITMPLMNGIELCKNIKEEFASLKVMVLSMHNSIGIVKEAIAADADGYMLKNIGQDEFLFGLTKLVEDGSYYSQEIAPIIFRQYHRSKQDSPVINLSPREKEILSLISLELTSKEIADKLFISKQTVDTHRINIMQKTNSKSVVGLIKYAIQAGISG
ncbi:MAG: response regulator transcription factor [Bacteroidetes bacterium]|nr:response regulator transcription factor [Bacteroidota bacterium]MCA6443762.1 response regulator transcription factor [Bacteroidota bacterium]